MGHWEIKIWGEGAHHFGNSTSADQIALHLLDVLASKGQRIERATFLTESDGLEVLYDINGPQHPLGLKGTPGVSSTLLAMGEAKKQVEELFPAYHLTATVNLPDGNTLSISASASGDLQK